MYYIELSCKLNSDSLELLSAYLITGLSELGFETFDEEESSLKAYIPETGYSQTSLEELINEIPDEFGKVTWEILKIEQKNWNSEWEKHFNPVIIYNTVLIKATFHKNLPEFPYEIVIDPKMSFGTGHHSTTALMIKTMLSLPFAGTHVLDMGCGTGVLAILAHKLGATNITAIDIDEWAVSNAKENFELNEVDKFDLLLGGAEIIGNRKFDFILANINRNILINDMTSYATALKQGGVLLISGIYHTDLELVRYEAEQNQLTYKNHLEKKSWIAARFTKL
ncbi:MAG: 50S ribosomal protein L11 methyltransferase [Bacteroidales bacterium]|nr:50S ribosomal protein L11 methyltransferase [Bacteroidales bacterium]